MGGGSSSDGKHNSKSYETWLLGKGRKAGSRRWKVVVVVCNKAET